MKETLNSFMTQFRNGQQRGKDEKFARTRYIMLLEFRRNWQSYTFREFLTWLSILLT